MAVIFKRVAMSPFVRNSIASNGSADIKQCVREDGGIRLSFIYSKDQSGPFGEWQRHVSISVLHDGMKRRPTKSEVDDVLAYVVRTKIDRKFTKNDIVHVYMDDMGDL